MNDCHSTSRDMPLRLWSLVLTVLLAFAVGAFAQESKEDDEQGEEKESESEKAPETVELGKKAPQFTLPDESGQERSLSDYEGRIIILEWTDTQCPAVQQQYNAKKVQETYEEVKKLDSRVVWLSINSTSGNSAKENEFWKKRYDLEWPILMDRGGGVAQNYAVSRVPHVFVIDEEGVLRYHGALHDDYPVGKIQPPKQATNYVVEAVRELSDDEPVSVDHVEPWGCFGKFDGGGGREWERARVGNGERG